MTIIEKRIPSDTIPGRKYFVRIELWCQCPGFTRWKYCKHLRREIDAALGRMD